MRRGGLIKSAELINQNGERAWRLYSVEQAKVSNHGCTVLFHLRVFVTAGELSDKKQELNRQGAELENSGSRRKHDAALRLLGRTVRSSMPGACLAHVTGSKPSIMAIINRHRESAAQRSISAWRPNVVTH